MAQTCKCTNTYQFRGRRKSVCVVCGADWIEDDPEVLKKAAKLPYRFWSEEDKKFLLDNYGKLSGKELAKALGRSYDTIRAMAYKLNKAKNGSKKK